MLKLVVRKETVILYKVKWLGLLKLVKILQDEYSTVPMCLWI